MASFSSAAMRYGLNAPVIAAALLILSVTVFGESSRDDVCAAYSDVTDDLQSFYFATDRGRDSNIETLAQAAKSYSADSDIQQDGSDLEDAHGDTYTAEGIYSAIPNIALMCSTHDVD